ncbi:MAG TPA: hypothetical protein VKX28_02190 [Xanthobacteraceae bacterium]|nr:hypothetical protein [Xanthobacteraceae bacterium]
MTTLETHASPLAEGTTVSLDWTPVVAGAFAAAALAFVLHSFAVALGLSMSSSAPAWRDTSSALVLLSGLWLLLVALVSYGFGGYLAARLRARFAAAPVEDVEFRDGMHGLIVWALATLLAGMLALAIAEAAPRLIAPSTTNAGQASSVAGENLIGFDLDRLFRSERRPAGDMSYARSEAARILLTTSSHAGMQADDRAYLVHLVTTTTGLAPADADRRVTQVAAQAKTDIDRARHSALIIGFMAGAAALIGAVAAWFAACAGGRHRDGREAVPAYMDWGRHTFVHRP